MYDIFIKSKAISFSLSLKMKSLETILKDIIEKIGVIAITIVISGIIIIDEIDAQVIYDPVIEKVAEGIQFTEGPVWADGLGLLFTDIPQNKIFIWNPGSDATVYLEPTGKANGLAIDHDGYLIMCQHFDRQIGKYTEGEGIEPLASHYKGKRLNSPNDLTIKSDGSIFFTDPPFGLNDEGGTSELEFSGIYRLSPSGDVQLLDSTLNYPNGITFSPDESKLYVSESDVADVYVWDVIDDTTINNKTLFADIPGSWADGMKVDAEGYLYVTGPKGLWIYASDGTLILSETIIPGTNSTNCNWGPTEDSILYITAGNSVYQVTNKVIEPDDINRIEVNRSVDFELFSPQPNPLSGETLIPFFLNQMSRIQLSVLNSSGKEVNTLADNLFSKGEHALIWETACLADGVYFIVMEAEQFLTVQRCVKVSNN